MCQLYSGQNPDNYQYVTRSIRMSGFTTSVRLEARFWEILDEIAAGQGTTTPRFLSIIHDEVIERRGEIGNFASILRVACIVYLQRGEREATASAA